MVLISAHIDTVFYPYKLSYKNGVYCGLLDNIIGVMAANSLLEDVNIRHLEKNNKVRFHFAGGEEWGINYDLPKLTKRDLVIVVDICSGKQYDGLDFSLENISGVNPLKIKELKESLQWEGFKLRTKKYTGEKDDEDEAFQWHEMWIPVISFIIPIENGTKDTGWHNEDCTITIEKFNKAKQGLKRLINYSL